MKNTSVGPDNIYILVPGPFRVQDSSQLAPTKAPIIFPYISLYNKNAPKIIKNDLSADLKIYEK